MLNWADNLVFGGVTLCTTKKNVWWENFDIDWKAMQDKFNHERHFASLFITCAWQEVCSTAPNMSYQGFLALYADRPKTWAFYLIN